jgi:hypothetical protein
MRLTKDRRPNGRALGGIKSPSCCAGSERGFVVGLEVVWREKKGAAERLPQTVGDSLARLPLGEERWELVNVQAHSPAGASARLLLK